MNNFALLTTTGTQKTIIQNDMFDLIFMHQIHYKPIGILIIPICVSHFVVNEPIYPILGYIVFIQRTKVGWLFQSNIYKSYLT